jgi:ribosomal protein L20
MGGPVAAKKLVENRRRRRSVGGARVSRVSKKRVVRKPKKQYIKLTPYQFKRLTDHIKKNNLRKVLIKEITH